ncbi:hypothetical protein [Flavobacterium sp. CS20]|uniref:hypothetical protein n=1 Tax=Flavobacterium sp. CS20 TaxID=2775246 RepID=UPI001B39F598|nr:hypothetical protein [Flavobacterium sp. CS20]QTY27262.1 hypothetical protein IGB25_01365 [Flavobacterium sp. CS20]
MEIEELISKIKHPEQIQVSDEMAFKKLAINYPYFQVAQALHLKILKSQESFEFKRYLRSTALHTTNREMLFDFINRTLDEQEQAVETISKNQDQAELGISEDEARKINDPDLFERRYQQPQQNDEKHSFYEWLNLTKLKPLEKNKNEKKLKSNPERQKKEDLINKFIRENPKINQPDKTDYSVKLSVKTKPSQEMMTETLAKIYLEQKKYDKAIEAYNILILNNPKKSGFFADQIKMIKALQEHN